MSKLATQRTAEEQEKAYFKILKDFSNVEAAAKGTKPKVVIKEPSTEIATPATP